MYKIPEHIPADIFRAYDIRGIVDETLTEDLVYAVGRAFASEALNEGQESVVIARDGRLSAERLFNALSRGLLEGGCDVTSVGAVPTPLLYYATYKLEAYTGVMLTGSHNPSNYNGIKMVINNKTLTTQRVEALRDRIINGQLTEGDGRYQIYDTIDRDYINAVSETLSIDRPLKVAVDCGNGIGGAVFPRLLETLGCEIVPLYCEVDGRFPNHHPDPAVVANMKDLQQTVVKQKADIGLALDGDCDRLGVVTEQGAIVWPDRYLMLLAKEVLQNNPGGSVIFDVKCSRHLPEVIKQYGGQPYMWKTGHSLLKMKLQEMQAPLAGELSGHVFFSDRWYGFDDGLYAGARLLEALAEDGRPMSQILHDFPDDQSTPELKLYVPEAYKFELMDKVRQNAHFNGAAINTIDGLRVDYPDGWGLVRPSNTTPCLVLRFEASSDEAIKRIQESFREQLLAVDSELELPF